MNFNDEQLPNENSMHLLRCGYANKVKTLENEEAVLENEKLLSGDNFLNAINNNIDWQGNNQLLNFICNTAPNRCVKNYVRGLMDLNKKDESELNSFYNEITARKNPKLVNNSPSSFNNGIKQFIKNEAKLLDDLIQLVKNEDKQNFQNSIFNIIRRRLDAVDTLVGFMSNTIFG